MKTSDTLYKMTNKYSESLEFTIINNVGYLTKITNSANDTNIIEYDSANRIIKITDANNSVINIVYDTNKITFSSANKTVIVNCNDNYQMTSLVKDGYTTSFSYNNLNLII